MEGGLEEPEEEPEPEEAPEDEDPPVDVDPEVLEEPEVLVGGLEEDPDVVGGGLEVVGGEGGGAKRRTGVFAETLKEVAAYVAAMRISERRERMVILPR